MIVKNKNLLIYLSAPILIFPLYFFFVQTGSLLNDLDLLPGRGAESEQISDSVATRTQYSENYQSSVSITSYETTISDSTVAVTNSNEIDFILEQLPKENLDELRNDEILRTMPITFSHSSLSQFEAGLDHIQLEKFINDIELNAEDKVNALRIFITTMNLRSELSKEYFLGTLSPSDLLMLKNSNQLLDELGTVFNNQQKQKLTLLIAANRQQVQLDSMAREMEKISDLTVSNQTLFLDAYSREQQKLELQGITNMLEFESTLHTNLRSSLASIFDPEQLEVVDDYIEKSAAETAVLKMLMSRY